MAVHASHAALPYPIKGARFSMEAVYLDADGDPTDPTTPDTEISKDNGAFADCTEEVTVATGTRGGALMTFTSTEMDCSCAKVWFGAASGPKATLATLYPRVLASIGTGTLSAGSAGGGTLGTVLTYDVTGCFIKTTGGTGGGGAANQARQVATYNTGTGAFTVVPNWETTPDATTTYEVLLPQGVTLGMLRALNPGTAGRTLVVDANGQAQADLNYWKGTILPASDTAGFPKVTIKSGAGTGEISLSSGGVSLSAAGLTAVTAAVLDENVTSHRAANSVGAMLQPLFSGTCGAGDTTHVILTGGSADTDVYKYSIVEGWKTSDGSNKFSAICSAYNGGTKSATINTIPYLTDSSYTFVVRGLGQIPGATAPTADENAVALLNKAYAAYTTPGTLGSYLNALGLNWGTAQGGAASSITIDTTGNGSPTTNDIVKYQAVTVWSGTGALQTRQCISYDGTSKALGVNLPWTVEPVAGSKYLIHPLGLDAATVATIATGVWAATRVANATAGTFGEYGNADMLRVSGNATAANNQRSFFDGTGYAGTNNVIPTVTTVGSVTGAVGSVTGAVGSVTGAVGSVTGNVGGNVVGSVASVTGNVGGNVVGSVASVTGAVGSVTGNVSGNVVGAVGSVTTVTDKTGYRLSAAGVDDFWDEAVDGSTTGRQAARLWNSVLGGKASGLATTTAVYRDLADTKNRVSATVDADGNRSALTLDLT